MNHLRVHSSGRPVKLVVDQAAADDRKQSILRTINEINAGIFICSNRCQNAASAVFFSDRKQVDLDSGIPILERLLDSSKVVRFDSRPVGEGTFVRPGLTNLVKFGEVEFGRGTFDDCGCKGGAGSSFRRTVPAPGCTGLASYWGS